MTTLVCLLTAAGSVCLPSGHAGATAHLIPKDSIIIQKQIINKKHLIHLYTNASQQVLFFSVDGEEGKNYQLLLFRDKRKLIKQSMVRNRETAVVSKPEKGNYYYEVLTGDNRIESGTIVVQ
ncbi:MAG TPA: hypothetical protein PLQ65_04060 [Flavihumibacter sp.]|nr:hypothetical protein [Bacteroidota bacterium]HOA37194.1 hypothetical protein [Flavihumibacter sp.]HQD08814.1 hypothetical protein [Flavihumibacter sp.]